LYDWKTSDGAKFGYLKFQFDLEFDNSWNRIETGIEDDHLILVLQSGDELYVAWRSTLSTIPYGWNPNFWLILMSGVMFCSILCGLLHVFAMHTEQLER
jgi:hypothetical protein